jgi:ABC-type antimicrobial peptide transport system permease subunit
MRILLINHIETARQSLHSNRSRSFLTILGVAIGVASITAILALSSGVNQIISKQVEALGDNIAVVRPGLVENSIEDIRTSHSYMASTLSEADLSDIAKINHVQSAAPIMTFISPIKADAKSINNSTVIATNSSLANISNLKMQNGQFLDQTLDRDTAVVGYQLSVNLFGTDDSIGRSIVIHGQSFLVVGVLRVADSSINYDSINYDQAAIIGLSAGKKLNQNVAQIQQIDIKADSAANLKLVTASISQTLIKNHDGETDFSILAGKQIARPTNQLFQIITGFITAVASISLIVGGVGIMNIMLVSVTERTREIGIRKALGASNLDILCQFLIESLMLSFSGCLIGYLGGYLVAFITSTFLMITPGFSWSIVLVALGLSAVVGGFFGLYPAIRAAQKGPIEALHQC